MKQLLLAIGLLFGVASASGQEGLRPELASRSWDVFLQQPAGDSSGASTETRVVFVDLLTGESTTVETVGERHTLFDGAVLYFDLADRQVKLVKPDGLIRDHPYLAMTADDYRVDWAVARDGRRIVWAVSRRADDELLTTTLTVADAAGAEARELLVYGPRQGIRLAPLAFTGDGESIYVEVRADTADAGAGYVRRSGLFLLDFSGDNVATSGLPVDGACYCAVGFGAGVMARLVPEGASGGIRLDLHDLGSGGLLTVPPVSPGDYNAAGNILISPDDVWAVYALSRVDMLAAGRDNINSVVVLADLENARQMVVNYPMNTLVRPLSWTEGNNAILFTQEGLGGTWKMQLDDGETVKVADGVHLGRLGGPGSRLVSDRWDAQIWGDLPNPRPHRRFPKQHRGEQCVWR